MVADVTPEGQTDPLGTERLRDALATMPRQVREELTRRLRRSRRALREEDVQVVEPPLLKRAVGASALGNCMEWFDFGVYSY
ncbi:MFS transporter, partial [Streptomyces sp. SID89]|nr:MFS transporter [Streptomyces sp. SID89]